MATSGTHHTFNVAAPAFTPLPPFNSMAPAFVPLAHIRATEHALMDSLHASMGYTALANAFGLAECLAATPAAPKPLSSAEAARAMAVSQDHLVSVSPTEAGDGTVVKLAPGMAEDAAHMLQKIRIKNQMRDHLKAAVCAQ